MKLLVHLCCADCSLRLLDALKKSTSENLQITLFFYNPNIHPETEYQARQKAVKAVLGNSQKVIFSQWTPKAYFDSLVKLSDRNRPLRCQSCWQLRIDKLCQEAKLRGFDSVSSTLLTSVYHDQQLLRPLFTKVAKKYQLNPVIPKEIDHCLNTTGFYKQNYCGCIYSLNEKYREKYLSKADR